jgi:hypothetical protein
MRQALGFEVLHSPASFQERELAELVRDEGLIDST